MVIFTERVELPIVLMDERLLAKLIGNPLTPSRFRYKKVPFATLAVAVCCVGILFGAMVGFMAGQQYRLGRSAFPWTIYGALTGLGAAFAWWLALVRLVIKEHRPSRRHIDEGTALGAAVGAIAGLVGYAWMLLFWSVVPQTMPNGAVGWFGPLAMALAGGCISGMTASAPCSLMLHWSSKRALPRTHALPRVNLTPPAKVIPFELPQAAPEHRQVAKAA